MVSEEIYAKLNEIVGEKTNGQTVAPDTNLTDLGLDSLDRADIMMQIEDEFGIQFTEQEMVEIVTLADLEKCIRSKVDNL